MAGLERQISSSEMKRDPYNQDETISIPIKPRNVSDREAHLRVVRRRYGYSQKTFAHIAGLVNYHRFESNHYHKLGPENIDKAVGLIGEIADENDKNAISAVTLLAAERMNGEQRERISEFIDDAKFNGTIIFRREKVVTKKKEELYIDDSEKNWLHTITQKSLQTSVRYIRINNYQTQGQFAKASGVSVTRINEIERGIRMPSLPSINKIIRASSLEYDGKAAQLLRLKIMNKQPMDIETLKNASLGELITYLRNLKGLYREELGNIIYRSKTDVSRIELNGNIPSNIEDQVIAWAKPGTALKEIIKQKATAPNIAINEELFQQLSNENYLFVDKETSIEPSKPSSKDRKVISSLKKTKGFGEALALLRNIRQLTHVSLAKELERENYSSRYINRLERDIALPLDHTLGSIMYALRFDIHHPVTQYMIDRLDAYREIRDAKR